MLSVRVDADAVLDDARVAVPVGHEEVLRVVRHCHRGRLAVVRVIVAGFELEKIYIMYALVLSLRIVDQACQSHVSSGVSGIA